MSEAKGISDPTGQSHEPLSYAPQASVDIRMVLTNPNDSATPLQRRPEDTTMKTALQEASQQRGLVDDIIVTRKGDQFFWRVPKYLAPTRTVTEPATVQIDDPTIWVEMVGTRDVTNTEAAPAKPSTSSQPDDSHLARFFRQYTGDVSVRISRESLPIGSFPLQAELDTVDGVVRKKGGYGDADPTRTAIAALAKEQQIKLVAEVDSGNGGHRLRIALGTWSDDDTTAAGKAFRETVIPTKEQPFSFKSGQRGTTSDAVLAKSNGFVAVSPEFDVLARPSALYDLDNIRRVSRPDNFSQNGPVVGPGEPKVSWGKIVPTQVEPGTPYSELPERHFEISQNAYEGGHRALVGAPNQGKSLEMMRFAADIDEMYRNQVDNTVLTSLLLDMSDKIPETQMFADMLKGREVKGQEVPSRVIELNPVDESGFAYGIGGFLNPLPGESPVDHGLRFVQTVSLAAVKDGGMYSGDVKSFVENTVMNAWFGHGEGRSRVPGLIELGRPVTPADLPLAFEKAIEDVDALKPELRGMGQTNHGRELINSMRRLTSLLQNPAWKHFFTSRNTIDWLQVAKNGERIALRSDKLESELRKIAGLTILGNIQVAQDQLNAQSGGRITYRTGTYIDESGRLLDSETGVKYADKLAQGRSRGSDAKRGGNTMTLAAQMPESLKPVLGLVRTYGVFAVEGDTSLLPNMIKSDDGRTKYALTQGVGEAQAYGPGMHNGSARILTAPKEDSRMAVGQGKVVSPVEAGLVSWGIHEKPVTIAMDKRAEEILRKLPDLPGWEHIAMWTQNRGFPLAEIAAGKPLADILKSLSDEERDVAVTKAVEKIVDNVHEQLARQGIDSVALKAYLAPRLRTLAAGKPLQPELPNLRFVAPDRIFVPVRIAFEDFAEPEADRRYPELTGGTVKEQIAQADKRTENAFNQKYQLLKVALRQRIVINGNNAAPITELFGDDVPGNTAKEQYDHLVFTMMDEVIANPARLGEDWVHHGQVRTNLNEYRDRARASAPRHPQTEAYEEVLTNYLGYPVKLTGNRLLEQLDTIGTLDKNHTPIKPDPLNKLPTSGEIIVPRIAGGNPLDTVAEYHLAEAIPVPLMGQGRSPKTIKNPRDHSSSGAMIEGGKAQEWSDNGVAPLIDQLDLHADAYGAFQEDVGAEMNQYVGYHQSQIDEQKRMEARDKDKDKDDDKPKVQPSTPQARLNERRIY